MRYFLAIILPPLAVFLCAKPIQALLNLVLTVLGWIPGVIHAFFVVNGHLEDKRANRIVNAMKREN